MKEKKMKIVETFHKIPETIRIAEDRLADYPDDELLYDAATGLFIAVLRAIEGMLGWLVGTSTCASSPCLLPVACIACLAEPQGE